MNEYTNAQLPQIWAASSADNKPYNRNREMRILRKDLTLSYSLIVDLLFSLEDLRLRQIPAVTAQYQIKIGCWEIELLRNKIATYRAKRKCELAQMNCNMGIEIDTFAIEKQVEVEVLAWEDELEAKQQLYVQALEYHNQAPHLTLKQNSQCKSLFRTLLSRMHPELYPSNAQVQQMYELARQAYCKGDLEVLVSMEANTRTMHEFEKDDICQLSADQLCIEIEVCSAHLALLREKLDKMRYSNPLCLKNLLQDSKWVCKCTTKSKDKIAQAKKDLRLYEQRYLDIVA